MSKNWAGTSPEATRISIEYIYERQAPRGACLFVFTAGLRTGAVPIIIFKSVARVSFFPAFPLCGITLSGIFSPPPLATPGRPGQFHGQEIYPAALGV